MNIIALLGIRRIWRGGSDRKRPRKALKVVVVVTQSIKLKSL